MKDGIPWRERKRQQLLAQRKNLHPRVTPPLRARKVPENHNPHGDRKIAPWERTDEFRGRIFCLVGGGPSLKDKQIVEQMKAIKRERPDIVWLVVNNSYKLIGDAHILHFADAAWWEWNHRDVLANFKGIVTTATSETKPPCNHPRLKRFHRNRNQFSTEPHRLHGWDSGTQAVNMAYHLGATKIVLWGFDMCVPKGETPQWHNEHRRATNVKNYLGRFAPSLAEVVRRLEKLGVPVVRATEPGIPEAVFLGPEAACQVTGGQP